MTRRPVRRAPAAITNAQRRLQSVQIGLCPDCHGAKVRRGMTCQPCGGTGRLRTGDLAERGQR